MKRLIRACLVACVAGMLASGQAISVKGIRLFSGSDGQTHAEEINLTQASRAQPELLKANNISFATRAAGTSDDWHTAPRRQYLITLKGRVEIEIGDGQRVTSTPGTVLLIEDLTGKGHRAHVVGTEEWHVMFIPLAPGQ